VKIRNYTYTNVVSLPLYMLSRSSVFTEQQSMHFKDIRLKLLKLMHIHTSRTVGCSKLLVMLSYLYLRFPEGLVLSEIPTKIQVLVSLWHIVKYKVYSLSFCRFPSCRLSAFVLTAIVLISTPSPPYATRKRTIVVINCCSLSVMIAMECFCRPRGVMNKESVREINK